MSFNKSYITRFALDDEIGVRGCELVETRGDVGLVRWFVPRSGLDYPLGGTTEQYRAAQEQTHEVPLADLYADRAEAVEAAIARAAKKAPAKRS